MAFVSTGVPTGVPTDVPTDVTTDVTTDIPTKDDEMDEIKTQIIMTDIRGSLTKLHEAVGALSVDEVKQAMKNLQEKAAVKFMDLEKLDENIRLLRHKQKQNSLEIRNLSLCFSCFLIGCIALVALYIRNMIYQALKGF